MNKSNSEHASILIIDNDVIVCKLFEVFLETENYTCLIANSGRAAFEILENNQVDLILLDIMMPEMSGFEVCEILQANPKTKNIPVIFVTAKDDQESYVHGFSIGAIDYLNKPINRLELIVKIRNYINLRKNENKLRESEKKFKNIFHSTSDCIVITNFDHRILEANESFYLLFPQSSKIKKDYLIGYIHYSDVARFEKNFSELLASGTGKTSQEVRIMDTNNSLRFFEISSKIIDYENHKAVLFILRDITEMKEVHLKILNTIIDTEEKERIRFAQDLHDGLGPLLSTIKLYNKTILSAKTDENKAIAIEKSIHTIDEAIFSIKEIANNLSPHILKNFGLVVAINSFVNKFSDSKNINISFQPEVEKKFNQKTETALFRIVVELINNTLKHACAKNIIIGLDCFDGVITLSYTDDGIGCDLKEVMDKTAGHGISNIISRTKSIKGEIVLNSGENRGFYAKICIPDELETTVKYNDLAI
jgi:PAS domain S-box-containing protein